MKLKKLRIGQRIKRFPAKTWNALVDHVERSGAPRINPPLIPVDRIAGSRNHGVMLFRNDTGQNRDTGELAGFAGPAEDPNQTGQAGEAVEGNVPNFESAGVISETAHVHSHAVWIEPVAYEEWGWATTTGLVFAKVDVHESGHKFAKLKTGQYWYESAEEGPYPIVWKPSGLGVRRCVVRLDAVGGGGETFKDLLVSAIIAEDFTPSTSGTGTSALQLAEGYTAIIHGPGAYTTPPTVLKQIQVLSVENHIKVWAPKGSQVIATAHDTGQFTSGQSPPTNNGLPIYKLVVIAVEPPEFVIELELDDDLPPIRDPMDIDYKEVDGRPFKNIWGICPRSEFLTGDKATFNPSLLSAKKGQPVIASVRRLERPLPGASTGDVSRWQVTIVSVPANTLSAYGFLASNCSITDQDVQVQYVQGIGWKLPTTGSSFPHGPTPARNIWGLRGRTGYRCKLTYVPGGLIYPGVPGGTPGDLVYWLIDMILPVEVKPVTGLKIDDLDFQKQQPIVVGWSHEEIGAAQLPWTTWASGEMCPTSGASGGTAAQRQTAPEGGGKPDCGCGGGA